MKEVLRYKTLWCFKWISKSTVLICSLRDISSLGSYLGCFSPLGVLYSSDLSPLLRRWDGQKWPWTEVTSHREIPETLKDNVIYKQRFFLLISKRKIWFGVWLLQYPHGKGGFYKLKKIKFSRYLPSKAWCYSFQAWTPLPGKASKWSVHKSTPDINSTWDAKNIKIFPS